MVDMLTTPTTEKFIRHWGEMGTRWGINRTVAQVHALLYISERPLNAEELVSALEVARSNISSSIKELQSWGLVTVVHIKGDRRDHFTTEGNIWEMFRIIADERKRREFDPTERLLAECVADAKASGEKYSHTKLRDLHEFFTITGSFYNQARSLPAKALIELLRLGSKFKNIFRM